MKTKDVEKFLENEIEVAEQMLQQDTIVCEFCGQVLIDRECNCYESHEAERKKKNIQKALDITLPTLTDEVSCTKFEFLPIYDEHLLKLLRQMVLDVGNEVIEKTTLRLMKTQYSQFRIKQYL